MVADGALDCVGVVGYDLGQVAVTVLHQAVIPGGSGAGLDLFADVPLVLVGTLDHAGGFLFIHAQLDQRLDHRVATAVNDQRVLELRVDRQHIAALLPFTQCACRTVGHELVGHLLGVRIACHQGKRFVVGDAAVATGMGRSGRHVDTRAECALFAGLDASDGLLTLATLSGRRAVVQALRDLAWLEELLEVGFPFSGGKLLGLRESASDTFAKFSEVSHGSPHAA